MKFGEGQPGANKLGRPKGSVGGRIQALLCLDKMLARRKTQATLIRALDDEFKKNPIGFFRTIVMPLLPREAKLSLDHDGVLEWKSMLGSLPATAEAQPTGQVIDVPAEESGRGDE